MKQQSGRTLTEMLGVLAIMGILSITAIFGYSYAMNKHRANVILNDVKRITVFILSSDFMQKEGSGIEDLDIEVESDTPYVATKESPNTFYITAGETNKRICDILVQSKPIYAEETIPNAVTSRVCEENKKNEIYFYINTDMQETDDADKPQACGDSIPCFGCQECVAGRCVDKDSKCPKGQFCVKGVCATCPKGTIVSRNDASACEKCDDIQVTTVFSPSECTTCPGLNVFVPYENIPVCVRCPAGTIYDTVNGGCTGCPSGQLWSTNTIFKSSQCSSCSLPNAVATTLSECHRCLNTFMSAYGICQNCNTTHALYETTLTECNRCSNRVFITNTKSCQLCPSGSKPVGDGTCTGCPSGQFWSVGGNGDENKCSVCSSTTGMTVPAVALERECYKCDNTFIANKFGCYGCKIGRTDLKNTLAECNRCSERYFDTPTQTCRLCPAGQVKNAAGTGCEVK